MIPIGAKVEIAVNKATPEVIADNPTTDFPLEPEIGEVVSFYAERDERFLGHGPSYLVKVLRSGDRDRMRYIPENKLTVL